MIEHSAVDVPGGSAAFEGDIGPFIQRNTPSPAGYVLGALSALGIGSVLVPLALHGGVGDASDFLMLVGPVLTVGPLVVLTISLPLILIAHLAVRGVRHQSLHVAAFGVVGLLTGYLVRLWFGTPGGLPLVAVVAVVAVGVSAAAGRAVVNRRPR